MEAVIDKLEIVRSGGVSTMAEVSVRGGTEAVARKVNEIIDRLNDEPTLVEVAEALKSSDFPSDKTLVVSLERARKRWEEARR